MSNLCYCESAAQGCTLSLNCVLPAMQEEVFVLPRIEFKAGWCITLQVSSASQLWQFDASALRAVLITVTNAVFRRAVQSVRNLAVACRRFYQNQICDERELLRLLKMARRL